MIKTFKTWIVKYFSNILGVISFLTTIFFGYFFVPVAYNDYKEYKKNYALIQVVQSTKELIYSDSVANYKEIKDLIESKQSSLNENLDKSPYWYLRNASNSFMEDKFLSLSKRRELNEEISEIIIQIPKDEKKEEITITSKAENIGIWIISISITTLILALGIWSFYVKFINRRNEDEELKNEVEQANTEIRFNDKNSRYIYFEENIMSALKKLGFEFNHNYRNNNGIEFDIKFRKNKKDYFIETKFLQRTKVGLKSITHFISKVEYFQGVGIFVHNTELTALSKKRLVDFNKERSDLKIYNIRFTNEDILAEQIKNIVDKTA